VAKGVDVTAGGPHEGGCFCGRVRYRVSGEPLRSAICHCVSCRRTSGALSVAWVSFPYRRFSFIEGEPADFRSSDEVSRTFCQSCGTSLTYRDDEDADCIDVTTASLDRPDEFPPTRHIWLEDKLAWENVDDGLPRFEQGS
jgi:hypothetical protein